MNPRIRRLDLRQTTVQNLTPTLAAGVRGGVIAKKLEIETHDCAPGASEQCTNRTCAQSGCNISGCPENCDSIFQCGGTQGCDPTYVSNCNCTVANECLTTDWTQCETCWGPGGPCQH